MLKYFFIFIIMFCICGCTKHNYFYELEQLQNENRELRKTVKFLSSSLIENSNTIQELNKKYKFNLSQKDSVIKYLKIRKSKKWNK